jgi:hypothetical protein
MDTPATEQKRLNPFGHITTEQRRLKAESSMSHRAEKIIERARVYSQTVPSAYRSLYLKARSGEASPREVIKAACQQCVNYEDVKNMVGDCTATTCVRWQVRPYQNKSDQEETEIQN